MLEGIIKMSLAFRTEKKMINEVKNFISILYSRKSNESIFFLFLCNVVRQPKEREREIETEMLCFGSTCCSFCLMIDRNKRKEICPRFQWISVRILIFVFFPASKRSKLYNNQSGIRQCGMFFLSSPCFAIFPHWILVYLDDSSNSSFTISSSRIRKSMISCL